MRRIPSIKSSNYYFGFEDVGVNRFFRLSAVYLVECGRYAFI